jgi:hypothetical protein
VGLAGQILGLPTKAVTELGHIQVYGKETHLDVILCIDPMLVASKDHTRKNLMD